ncbi:MAG: hypothetical protein GX951_00380 [Mollicutes bacterium]|nr:hypothetical protein [Mollicutes bacterium]
MKYLDKDILFVFNALKKNDISKEKFKKEALDNIKDTNIFKLINDKINYPDTDNILSCIPYTLKDNISTKDIITTAGLNTLKNYVPVYNATCYEKLSSKGAIMIGKPIRDELETSVKKDLVSYAIGTDTFGEIRNTSVVGYKPSYGLISRYGVFAYASSFDHVGIYAKNVLDATLVVDEIKGYDKKDMTSINDMDDIKLKDYLNNNVNGKKIFYIKELINDQHYMKEIIDKIKTLGIEIYEESIDINLLNAIKPVHDMISLAELSSNTSNLTGIIFGDANKNGNINDMMKKHRSESLTSTMKRKLIMGSYILQKENINNYFINAKKVRRLIVNTFNNLFNNYDALILPILSNKDNNSNNHLLIGNLGGYPSITVNINKMPISVNITGKYKEDGKALNIASYIEKLFNKEDKK